MIKIKGNIKSDFEAAMKPLQKKVMKKTLTNLQSATPVDTGKARDGWEIDGDRIINEVEYIENLNKGSSRQAPTHFIEKTLLSQKELLPGGTMVKKL